MHDVAIVGGGPGGLFAGLRLARQGFHVALFEEHDSIGEPVHCTGVLADEAFREFDIPRSSILNELTTARFFSPEGQSIDYTPARVEALVIDRRQFDATLSAEAAASGVAMFRRSRVTAVQVDGDGVVIDVAGRRWARARACVLACGANYRLQRQLGFGLPRLMLQTAQMELAARTLGDVELHFGSVIAPQGFAWAVPVRRGTEGYVRVGVMCERDAAVHFDRILERIAPRWGVDRDGLKAPRQKVLPLAPISKTYTDRVVAIGDAAGLVKPTTGGGIYYSLVSGSIAADVLGDALRCDRLDRGALRVYEQRWRRRLNPELHAQLSLRRIAERLTDAEIEGLFELARTDGIMPIVRRTAAFNRHRNLIVALFRHPPARKILFRRLLS